MLGCLIFDNCSHRSRISTRSRRRQTDSDSRCRRPPHSDVTRPCLSVRQLPGVCEKDKQDCCAFYVCQPVDPVLLSSDLAALVLLRMTKRECHENLIKRNGGAALGRQFGETISALPRI